MATFSDTSGYTVRLMRIDVLATAHAPLGDSIRINPRGHSSRVGLGFLGNDDAFPLRDLLGIQHLCRAYRFGVELPSCFTL